MRELSVDQVRGALCDCYDMQLPCNIVDLGLVREIAVEPDLSAPGAGIPGVPRRFRVQVVLTPTASDEAAEAHLRAQICNRLAGLETVIGSTILFDHEPPWHPGRITPAGRRALGLDGNRNLVQIR